MDCKILVLSPMTFDRSLQSPPGLCKDLNNEILSDTIILNDNQNCQLIQTPPIKIPFH